MKHLIRDSGSLEFVKKNVSFLRAEHLGLMSVLRVWTHRSHLILEGWTPRPWCHVSLEGWTPRSHVSVEDHGLMLVLRVWTPRSHLILEGWTPRSHLSVEDHGLMLVLRVWTPRSHLILEGWTPRSHVSLEGWTPRSHVSLEGLNTSVSCQSWGWDTSYRTFGGPTQLLHSTCGGPVESATDPHRQSTYGQGQRFEEPLPYDSMKSRSWCFCAQHLQVQVENAPNNSAISERTYATPLDPKKTCIISSCIISFICFSGSS